MATPNWHPSYSQTPRSSSGSDNRRDATPRNRRTERARTPSRTSSARQDLTPRSTQMGRSSAREVSTDSRQMDKRRSKSARNLGEESRRRSGAYGSTAREAALRIGVGSPTEGRAAGYLNAEEIDAMVHRGVARVDYHPGGVSAVAQLLYGEGAPDRDVEYRDKTLSAWKQKLLDAKTAGTLSNYIDVYERDGKWKCKDSKDVPTDVAVGIVPRGGGHEARSDGKKQFQAMTFKSSVDQVVFNYPSHAGELAETKRLNQKLFKGAAGKELLTEQHPLHGTQGKSKKTFDPTKVHYVKGAEGRYDIGNFPDDELRFEQQSKMREGAEMDIGMSVTAKVNTQKDDVQLVDGMLPTLYISHGPGAFLLSWEKHLPVMRNMRKLFHKAGIKASNLRAIVFFSSHWERQDTESDVQIIRTSETQRCLCDFQAADSAYEIQTYAPFGDEEVSIEIATLLRKAGYKTEYDRLRFLDSGVWMPMCQMPEEFWQVPVVQVTLPGVRRETYLMKEERHGAAKAKVCLEVGRALRPLRSKGVLIIGSGRITKAPMDPEHVDKWCKAVKRTVIECPLQDRWRYLQRWEELPYAREAHPQDENLLPLHVVAGAADQEPGKCLGDFRMGQRAMVHFKFGK